ncbi:WD40/YVTN/BNR-like repeat-containing protein [Stutzerimonas stutzeri]|uniref:WD40/YVTN/BNR-like repeat-containing protein n=1 Tax=Stutzerimonas stutzeri TaxID=316 RepID=UPI0015E2A086|nr:YCF48-related protein [Stutzerimonas stutzeri]MBA1277584.1 glycosyl hydrolase [Stutzerimonas stutzeri]
MSKLISYAFCLVVAVLVVYAFSPRSEETASVAQLDVTRVHINNMTRLDDTLIAVGERGTILFSEDKGQTWNVRHEQPKKPVTLTAIAAYGKETILAVGHDNLILRSTDRGRNWTTTMYDAALGEPLLGLWSEDGQQIYAFGSFGKFYVSADAGEHWSEQSLPINGEHLNSMDGAADGRRILVGEMGLVLRTLDAGKSWAQVEPFYEGSLFGVSRLSGSHWVAYGMRGNVFATHDDGATWEKVELGHRLPLYGHARTDDGGVLIVGSGGAFARLDETGELTQTGYVKGQDTLTSAVMLRDGSLIVAGQHGLRLQGPDLFAAVNKERS